MSILHHVLDAETFASLTRQDERKLSAILEREDLRNEELLDRYRKAAQGYLESRRGGGPTGRKGA